MIIFRLPHCRHAADVSFQFAIAAMPRFSLLSVAYAAQCYLRVCFRFAMLA